MDKHIDQGGVKATLFPALILSFSMIFLNATFLPIALPSISKSLSIDTSMLFWVVNVYFITTCSLLLLGGKLVKWYGPMRMFRLGIALYIIGSCLAFFSFHFNSLLLSRVICGAGGALVSPATFSVIIHVYKESVRGKKIGTLIGMSSVALMIGPFLGGVLTELLSWRALFLLNVLVGLSGLILSIRSKVVFTDHRGTLDFIGFFSFSLGVASLIYAISGIGTGCFSNKTLIALGLVVFFAFGLWRSSKGKHPYFEFSLFKTHSFLLAISFVFFCQGLLSITFFWPVYFLATGVVGSTPIQVGTIISFATLGIFIFSPISGVYFDKRGLKKPILIGFSALSISFLGIAFSILYPNLWSFVLFFIVFGIGIAFVATPLGTLSQKGVDKSTSGMVSGLYNTIRFFSAAIGIAILSSLGSHLHKVFFFRMLPKRFSLKNISFDAISKAKTGGLLQEQYSSVFSEQQLDAISTFWLLAYQKSFFYLHMGLFVIAFAVLCITIVCRKKEFINKFSK